MPNKRKYPVLWDQTKVIEAVKTGESLSDILRSLGIPIQTNTITCLTRQVRQLKLDTSHFKKNVPPNSIPKPIQEYLVKGRAKQSGSMHIKKRLFDAGLKQTTCELCGIVEWLGRPAPLELHHIDGDKTNNLIENLQILCANCHALTDTYCGKNIRPRREARSSRHPVTVKTVGSNPIGDAYGPVGKLAKPSVLETEV